MGRTFKDCSDILDHRARMGMWSYPWELLEFFQVENREKEHHLQGHRNEGGSELSPPPAAFFFVCEGGGGTFIYFLYKVLGKRSVQIEPTSS